LAFYSKINLPTTIAPAKSNKNPIKYGRVISVATHAALSKLEIDSLSQSNPIELSVETFLASVI